MDQIDKLASKYRYPRYMIERYLKLFGLNETKELLEANTKKIKKSIRINSIKIDPQVLISRMEKKGFRFSPISWEPQGFYIEKEPYSIGATSEYLQGFYFVQRAASMLPAIVLKPNKNDLILDMCASPGGKLIQIADMINNEGCIIGLDLNRERIKSLRSNISRCGIKNTLIYRMDAAEFPKSGIKVDKILLDAPCTGEGIIPFDESRKTSRMYDDILLCSQIQLKLIKAAIKCLKKGGTIVYSTCSIAPEENELVINTVLKENTVEIIDTGLSIGQPGLTEFFNKKLNNKLKKARRFYPHKTNTQGFFICKLKKL